MLLQQLPEPPLFLRYEDLIKAPEAVLRIALDNLGLPIETADQDRIKEAIKRRLGGLSEADIAARSEISTVHRTWPKDLVEVCSHTLRYGHYL